jgi:hypothetical protein
MSDQNLPLLVCCSLQFLCNEVAGLQQAGSLRQLQVFDVAHMAWRLKVASQLQEAIHTYEQVGPAHWHGWCLGPMHWCQCRASSPLGLSGHDKTV